MKSAQQPRLLYTFQKHLQQTQLFAGVRHLLLAVSGGVDSVVLAHLCLQSGYTCSIAHVNFQLRGAESDADENFVRELAKQLAVPFFIYRADVSSYISAHKTGTQEAARKIRYAWFNELLTTVCPSHTVLVTAHHADDNVETVLMNFFKGSGLNGLAGMEGKNAKILRPLLQFEKAELLQYAQEQQIIFREDASNLTDKYTRNFFRNTILPLVRERYAQADRGAQKSVTQLQDAREFYAHHLATTLRKLIQVTPAGEKVPVMALQKLPGAKTVLWEWIKKFGFKATQLDDVMHLCESESGKWVAGATHRILRNRKWLLMSPILDSVEADKIYMLDKDSGIQAFAGGVLSWKAAIFNGAFASDVQSTLVNAAELSYPVLLRKWKTGDYFYPLGMRKKKKLSRFFNDLKLTPQQRSNVWVLESNMRIVWVAGMRLDDRFKVAPETKDVVKFSLSPYGQKQTDV